MGKEISQGVQRGRKESEQVLEGRKSLLCNHLSVSTGLIDMEEVEKMTPRERLELAFRVGAMLGCPPILKPEDLLDVPVVFERGVREFFNRHLSPHTL